MGTSDQPAPGEPGTPAAGTAAPGRRRRTENGYRARHAKRLVTLRMGANRVLVALIATTILGAAVAYGLSATAGDMQVFAAFGLEKRIILPAMYALFAICLVWPSRDPSPPVRPRLPAWFWLLLASTVLSSGLSLLYQPFHLLNYAQGLALFAGGLIIAYAGFLSGEWTWAQKRNLFLLLTLICAISIERLHVDFTPFIGVLIPFIGGVAYLAYRVPKHRRLLVLFGVTMAVVYLVALWPVRPSLAMLAETGTTLLLLAAMSVPFRLRRLVFAAGLAMAACFAVVSEYVPLFVGDSDYGDVSMAQRGYEADRVMSAVFSTPWTALFGLGPGGTVDLSAAPDVETLEAAGRVLTAVPSVHLLTSHMLLKLGLVGVVALVAIVIAIGRQTWRRLSQPDLDVFDGLLLLQVWAGLAVAVAAATHFFANPLPLLFLGILTARRPAPAASPDDPPPVATATRLTPKRVREVRTLAVVTVTAAALVFAADRIVAFPSARDAPPPDGATPTWTAADQVAVFLGDSYTTGAGATKVSARFTTLIANRQGWIEVNLGRGGTGYLRSIGGDMARPACGHRYCASYREMIPEVVRIDPDIVVVNGGRNEIATPAWEVGVAAFFTELREALPKVRIIATSPIWGAEPVPEDYARNMRDVVRRAVTSVGGTYVDLGDPLLNRPDRMADEVQPNNAGHAAIANAFYYDYRRPPKPSDRRRSDSSTVRPPG